MMTATAVGALLTGGRAGDGFFAVATTIPSDVERQMLEKKS